MDDVQEVTPEDRAKDAEEKLVKLGMQYYVNARFSATAGLMPVAGNLAHLAVEMFLKANLARQGISLEELRDHYHHFLKRIWKKFKELNPGTDLSRFDRVISTLHRWERIRYPDLNKGMLGLIAWQRPSEEEVASHRRSNQPKYYLVVPDLDELIATIIRVSKKNPQFLKSTLYHQQAGLDVLFDDNPERTFWEGTGKRPEVE